MILRRVSVLAVVVGVGLLASGCNGEPAPAESTPLFANEQEAFAAAEQTYRDYVDALNAVDLSDPKTFEPVFALTTGDASANIRKSFTQMHADDWVVSGQSVVALLEPRSIAGDFETASLDVCLDVSEVAVVDARGASVVESGRVDVQSMRVELVAKEDDDPRWLIASLEGRDGEPKCAG